MRVNADAMTLYAVTDRTWVKDTTLMDQVKEALEGGITFLQLREKHLSKEEFIKEAREMKESGLMSIYLHGYTHTQYDKETPERLLSDTNKAQEDLENNLEDNNILKVFTYPYGLYTNAERDTLWQAGYVQNLTDNRINLSDKLDLSGLHRSYPLNNSVLKILLKIQYRVIRYK